MEKIEIIRQRYQEARKAYATASGSSAHYYEGKMVGIVDTLVELTDMSWIEAEVLLGKDQ